MEYKVKVVNGYFQFTTKAQEDSFRDLLASFNNTGKSLSISIEKFSGQITDAQLRLYKKIIFEGSNSAGYSFSEFENLILNSFGPTRIVKDLIGVNTEERIPVAQYSKEQFSKFIEAVVPFMNSFFNTNLQLYSSCK